MIIIRPETNSDVEVIRQVNEAAFPTDAEANLVDALRANGNLSLSLVAENDSGIIGHIAFSPVTITSSETARAGTGLAPMAVLPDHQRQGIGSDLVKAGIQRCRKQNLPFIVVLGHLDYYPRFGFRRALDWGIENEYGVDQEFMILELIPETLANCSGLATYGSEFATFE